MPAATARIEGEIRRLGCRDADFVVSTNIPVRRDGLPYANQRTPDDPGVAVYFTLKKKPRCFACDRWVRPEDNIAAIAMVIQALRTIERYGVGNLEQAFAGYQEGLPPAPDHDWHLVLGVSRSASVDDIERAYLAKARVMHPDVEGGSDEAMRRLNVARAAALQERAA